MNIHTHRKSISDNEWVLQSLRHAQALPAATGSRAYSVGIHPWDIHAINIDEALGQLDKMLNNPHVIALGESGLDKYAKAPLTLQTKAFSAQLELSVRKNIPVIIHAVKVNQELIAIKKDIPSSLPLIIHGFNGGAQLASSLVKAGFYLSLGDKLLRSQKLEDTLKTIGIQSVFLETDESDIAISKIYDYVSNLLKISNKYLVTHMVEKASKVLSLHKEFK